MFGGDRRPPLEGAPVIPAAVPLQPATITRSSQIPWSLRRENELEGFGFQIRADKKID
jgi:hypothetical protein